MRKRSLRIKTARTAMKIGAVKLRAVIFAKGEIDSAVKNISIAAMLITPLSACSPICLVRRTANLERIKSGNRKARPKMLRKNAIWNGGKTSETKRTSPCMIANATVDKHIKTIPRITGV